MLTQQENIKSTFQRVFKEAIKDLNSSPKEWIDSFHSTLYFTDQIDEVVQLWQASVWGYSAVCSLHGIVNSCFEDYQTRFKGAYVFPQDFFDSVKNQLMTDFCEKHQKWSQYDPTKLNTAFERQIKQQYHSIDTQWLSSNLQLPKLESLEFAFIFRR